MRLKPHSLRTSWALTAAAGATMLIVLAAAKVAPTAQGTANDPKPDKGWLGVYIQNIDRDLAESEQLKTTEGVMVSGVAKDSPAEKGGLRKGDIILRFDGKDAQSVRRLTRLIEWSDPGQKKDVVIRRDGKEQTITVTLGSADDEAAKSEENVFEVPTPPDMSDLPTPPRAYTFSLGQLSTTRIGVALYDMSDQLAEYFGAKNGGALINDVEKGGPAEKAGLKAGDVIVQIDHKPVSDPEAVRKAIRKKGDGEVATVTVLRGHNEEKTVDVKVESDNTWSGIGNLRGFRMRPQDTRWLDESQKSRREFMDAMRLNRDAQRQFREDLQSQLDDLRQELKDLQNQLKDIKR